MHYCGGLKSYHLKNYPYYGPIVVHTYVYMYVCIYICMNPMACSGPAAGMPTGVRPVATSGLGELQGCRMFRLPASTADEGPGAGSFEGSEGGSSSKGVGN